MAKKELVENIIKLYSKLGGNMSDVLGSRSNITFLGTGKNPEPFVDMSINMEAVGALGKSKVLKELESPMGYLTADKLNDVQAGKLYENMLKLDEFYNPKAPPANITDLATGTGDLDPRGLAALRSRVDDVDLPPPGSRGGADDIAAPLQDAETTFRNLEAQGQGDLAIQLQKLMMKGPLSNKANVPAKRASAREFLVEPLKADDTFSTKLGSVVSTEDVKFITEGGGGIAGDPLVLVEKYFGPRISEAIPAGATGEEIITFTRRVMDNVEDAAGLKPDNPRFDRFTAQFVDEMAKGGRAGFRLGKSVFKGIAELFKKGGDDVELIKQEKTFREGPITMKFLDEVDRGMANKFIRTRDMKGPQGYGLYESMSDMPKGLQAAEFIKNIRGPRGNVDYERAEMYIGGGVKLTGKETVDELIEMFLNAVKQPLAKGGLAKILEV